ncbi:MAG: ABC transporter permease [Candidatus Caldarchaeum sp.]
MKANSSNRLTQNMKNMMILFHNPSGYIALSILCILVIPSLFAEIISPTDPLAFVGPRLHPPSSEHPFGTDFLGRDVFVLILYGIRTTLLVSFLSTLIVVPIAILLGSLSGYFEGFIDIVLMKIAESFMVLPRTVFALILIAVLGPSLYNILISIMVTTWPQVYVIIRNEVKRVKYNTFIESAHAIGESNIRIILSEILPNITHIILTAYFIMLSLAAMLEATLSFFNLGDPNSVSIGFILRSSHIYIERAPWLMFFPGIFLTLFIVSLNMISDILVDPKNRGIVR